MSKFLYILKSLTVGKTLTRTLLDRRLAKEKLSGEVLDLGSGSSDAYISAIKSSNNVNIQFFDQKLGQETDFEKDALPVDDNSYDTVIFLNVLEHIYNHKHILREIKRIKKDDGRLVGFVPFLKWYHADPRDFFRYTHEALEKLLRDTGYTNIKIEPQYEGPYSTAFEMILPTLPKILRPLAYVPCYLLDILFRKLRARSAQRYVLGYYFVAQ